MTETEQALDFQVEVVALADLRPHPRNYRGHPEDQIEHIMESIREHGVYRNIVVARDHTILAGHGVVEAARRLGLAEIPVRRLPIAPDDPRALKVLTGDNEIEHLGEQDDRALTELLREIKEKDVAGLLGTGFDEMMLANLVFVTRPESEVQGFDEAAAWVGMPEYDAGQEPLKIMVSFANEEDRADFLRALGSPHLTKANSLWWPPRERGNPSAIRFEG